MHVDRKGKDLIIGFDSHDEAAGLYAVLTGTQASVAPEVANKGQWLYTWFFNQITKLAFHFDQEGSVRTQSEENMEAPVSSSKKARK